MTQQELIQEAIRLSKLDGKPRFIVEKRSGWVIQESPAGRGEMNKYETINTAMGWMSRQVGENFSSGRM